MIKVLIVDDQRLMRDGLSTLLRLESDLEVVGTAADGQEGVQFALSQEVDVVLMDIRMPVLDGVTALKQIHRARPDIRVLMLTTYDDAQDVMGALSAGALGYLLKDMPGEEIADSIRTAYTGGAVLPPRIAKTFLAAVQNSQTTQPVHDAGDTSERGRSTPVTKTAEALTDREQDVLHCLAKGMSNREIADTLFVTEGTVKNHVSNLIAKLGLRDRTQAALYAVRHGYGSR